MIVMHITQMLIWVSWHGTTR